MKFEFLTLGYDDCPPDQKPARFGFTCPRKGHMCSGMLLRSGPHTQEDLPQPERRTWAWDGNRTAPTFQPSIDCGGCGWHGFINSGVASNA